MVACRNRAEQSEYEKAREHPEKRALRIRGLAALLALLSLAVAGFAAELHGQGVALFNQASGSLSGTGDGDWYYGQVQQAGTLIVSLQGPTGSSTDFDLYVRVGSPVSTSSYDVCGFSSSSSERCEVHVSSGTTVYILVHSSHGAGSYTIGIQLASGAGSAGELDELIESPHPYPNGYNDSWTVRRAGASEIRVHFSKITTESGYDYVTLYDGAGNTVRTYSGSYSDFWSPWVAGGTIVVALRSDGSNTAYGFRIDRGETRGGSSSGAARDAWDPGDDQRPNGTHLEVTFSSQRHGRHTLDQVDQNDWFSVYLVAGTYYNFAAVDASGDTYAVLFDDEGAGVEDDDDSGEGVNFSLTYRPVSTGTYYLCVSALHKGEECAYTLQYSKHY